MYYNSGVSMTFTYPSSAKVEVCHKPVERYWNTNVHEHATNLVLMTTLDADQFAMQEGSIEIGAFVNDECRGSARLQEVGGRYVAFLVIHGEADETITFKIYDVFHAVEAGEAEEQFRYVSNAIMGSTEEPVVLHLRGTVGVSEEAESISLIPNPVEKGREVRIDLPATMAEATVEVVDMTGRVIIAQTNSGRDAKSCVSTAGMAPGVYTIRVISGNSVAKRKLVVR